MAYNASRDVEAPSCRDGCRVVLSSILLRKRARRHGRARSLSSHKSIAAKSLPKWRGSRGVSGNVCEGREGRIYSPAQTRTRFVLGYSCFLCHSDWAFRFRIIIIIKKKTLQKYLFVVWLDLRCPVLSSPWRQGPCSRFAFVLTSLST